MAFSTINKSTDYFVANLHTGTGSSQAITTGLNMSANGGMVWNKTRNSVNNHVLWDTIRGVQETIYPDLTAAEATEATSLTAFTTTGWTGGGAGNTNGSTITNVSWNWLANGAGSSNTDGDITSTVSVNTTAGFSIVKYTGNGSNAQTVGHGLGSVPKMIIVKPIDYDDHWSVYHSTMGNTKFLYLDGSDSVFTGASRWSDTSPTSSLFTIGTSSPATGGGYTYDYIAYCFSEISGYSKMESYTGNGVVDGTFVYTGFRPACVLIKCTSQTESWVIYDNKREGYNPQNDYLRPDTNGVESNSTTDIDLLSNGFKIRSAGAGHNNDVGKNYIYMAFAEAPFVNSEGIPDNAR
jgi:hypothetical protein